MTWLLVEDDPDIRLVVSMMMTVWGEVPLPLSDGNAAWAWLDSVENGTFTGELPELALMDIRMPGYTGDKIAARIRETTRIKDIPIVLMTAFSLTENEVGAIRERTKIDKLISKPLPDVEDLRNLLYQVRDNRKSNNTVTVTLSVSSDPPSIELMESSQAIMPTMLTPDVVPVVPPPDVPMIPEPLTPDIQPNAPIPEPLPAQPLVQPPSPPVIQPPQPQVPAPPQVPEVPQLPPVDPGDPGIQAHVQPTVTDIPVSVFPEILPKTTSGNAATS